ncbi:MAG TPA: hypothetical protein PKE69_24555 [Pyrinomonadaceae bacterium]|nr:hypothetical protein [Pyrinomonadaceae bacterium]
MSKTLADKIKNTQNSFAPQPPGATVPCPFAKTVSESPTAPVEVKTDFSLTQQILKTMGASSKPSEKPQVKKAWIEIILVDMVGKPIPNVRYRITTPDGTQKEGRLNEHGQAGVYQIDPGNCKITFPDLDKDAWE